LKLRPWAYLRTLGFKSFEEIARSSSPQLGPVGSKEGMVVGRHSHPMLHLSAVFYLNGDGSRRAVRCGLFAAPPD